MASERFVVLGLAHARSAWFGELGHWATSGALPADFVKCVSAEEVRARLASGRSFSALVADAGLPVVDRDLLGSARAVGCVPLVVEDHRVSRDWVALGAATTLPATFGRDDLLGALSAHARPIARTEARSDQLATAGPPPSPAVRSRVAALTGPGGTGVSTAAIALAQALADDGAHEGQVCLADLRLHAEQAVLHDAGDVLPGVQELVEAHRAGQPSPEEVRAQTFAVEERNYHLLLGLRSARFWSSLRRRAFEAAFESLQRAYGVLVCDVDPDLEGEDEGGSVDVEERHLMARTATRRADVVFVVGLPSMKGIHALVRVLSEVLAHGVGPDRVVPVVNCAPRSPRLRASLTAAVAELVTPAVARARARAAPNAGAGLATPVFLPERKVDDDLHDGARLPALLGTPLVGAFRAVLERAAPVAPVVPQRVRPRTLGRWTEPGPEVVNG